jgi:hypothetical protein
VGAERLETLIIGTDPVRGPYVDTTGVAQTAQAALGQEPAAEVKP